jgi:hypothetical protein
MECSEIRGRDAPRLRFAPSGLPAERPCLQKMRRRVKNPLASRKRLVKQSFPGVLAVAGTSVLAFRKPIALGDHSFQDIRVDCSKGRKPVALEECEQGPPACRVASILSKTAGARGET